MDRKNLKTNLIFTAAALAAALVLWLVTSGRPEAGENTSAVLTYGAEHQTMEIPLDTDAVYDVESGSYTIHLEVKDGAIRFVNSPCPDHLCEGYGWLSRDGDWAACLPALASVTVIAAE